TADLCRLWHKRGYFWEGRRWCEAVLAAMPRATERHLIAYVAIQAGLFSLLLGDRPAALKHGEAGLKIARDLEDPALMAQALYYLAWTERVVGNIARANDLWQESVRLGREVGDPLLLGLVLGVPGQEVLRHEVDDAAEARVWLIESERLLREVGELYELSVVLQF